MTISFYLENRDAVIGYLGASWPAPPESTVERVSWLSTTACGSLGVQDGPRPGLSWWVVDGVIVPQDIGPLPQLEGDELITLPPADPPTPPPLT